MSAEPVSWADALAHAAETFRADDSSENHVRLRVSLPAATRPPDTAHAAVEQAATTQPVMVWRGVSSVNADRVVIHVASPIAPEAECDVVRLARIADDLPYGALRTLGDLVHVHETLRLAGLTFGLLDAVIRLVANEAAQLAFESAITAKSGSIHVPRESAAPQAGASYPEETTPGEGAGR
ncbi:MAG: YbjN domain-containing protein [Ancrocorticia sp.]|nr:YbjN domain-containing protein [Ancrocorticia sp.]MCI1895889.1 YbjN domain-containing protein [Ancrocorticia sp.]MCI1932548.1 YbjN domain-containing protein [Ancrocorticia sp.]MCI1963700.1 YbjN domain-containing protein [Ancrocorticia sp.]MCI2003059.1 YbjN domain-containing protein [Ancrocorticia sp.]